MILYAILNNAKEKKFIECVAAENFEEILKYCNSKYDEKHQVVGFPVVYNAKGKLVSIQIKEV